MSDYIALFDRWHYQHYWQSPWWISAIPPQSAIAPFPPFVSISQPVIINRNGVPPNGTNIASTQSSSPPQSA